MIRVVFRSTLTRIENEAARRVQLCETLRTDLWAARNQAVAFEAKYEAAHAALVTEMARTDALTQTVVDLKREGFNPAPPPMEYHPTDSRVDPVIDAAIRDLASPDSPLYRTLLEDANRMMTQDMDVEAIAKAIRKGSDLNPFHA